MSIVLTLLRYIQVPDSGYAHTDNWNSPDLVCLPPSRRTWSHTDFLGFWNVIALSVSTWQSCNVLLCLGLNAWESMICIIIAKVSIFAIALLNGWGGSVWHIGYPIYSRFVFGMRGSYLALVQRIVLCIVWYSVQSFTAGMLVSLMLSSIFPSFNNLHNTFPSSLPMTTKHFTGYVIYHVISIPFLYIPPENLHKPFKLITFISFFAIFGTAIGSIVHNNGVGELLNIKSKKGSRATLGMRYMHGINSVINSFAVGLANQPDFSRFASKPGKQVGGQAVAILLTGTVVPLFGLLGTSAAAQKYGDVQKLNLWNPPNIIDQWLKEEYTARSRCASFFASFGFFASTLGLNTIDNGISGGIDLTALAPKWINIRRGAYLIMVVSILIQPWQIVENGSVFVDVLGSYGCFLGPMIGVFICDYFLVRKQKLKLSHLYIANSSSYYWFWHGFNWRGYASWIAGFVPGIVGFSSVNPSLSHKVPKNAIKLFQISFIIGFWIAFVVHYLINFFFPPPGIGEIDAYDVFHTFTPQEAEKLGVITDSKLSCSESDQSEFCESTDNVINTVILESKSLAVQ